MFNLRQFSHFTSKISVGFLLFTSPNGLWADWTTPVQISSSNSDLVDVAVDLSGNAVAVWQGYDGSNYIIQSSSLPYGGSWSSPSNLSATLQDAQGPEVAVDSLGNAVAVWSRFDGTDSIIQGATLPIGGSWSTAVNISVSGGNADSPELAMDFFGTVGNAVAIWHRYNGTNFIVQSSELPSGGSWSTPVNISPSGQDALIPEIAVDPNGNALAICTRYDGTNFTTRSAIRMYGDTWGPSIVLSEPGQTASQGNVAVDKDGNGVVVWSQFDGSNYVIQASYVPYGGSWSTPQSISITGEDAFTPMVVSDPAGNSVAVWVRFDGTNYVAQSSRTLSDGSWTTPVDISNSGVNVTNVYIGLNTSGYAVAVWDESDGTNSVIQSATLPLNGTWSTPAAVSTPGNYAYLPVVGVDDTGNAVSIWLESDGTNYYVWGSSLAFGS